MSTLRFAGIDFDLGTSCQLAVYLAVFLDRELESRRLHS